MSIKIILPIIAVSPAIMTFLLVNVSGVAMLERSLKDKKPGYGEYFENIS